MNNIRQIPEVGAQDKQAAQRAVAGGVANPRASAPTECPRCPSRWIEHIRAMRQYSREDWFRCDCCGYLFTM